MTREGSGRNFPTDFTTLFASLRYIVMKELPKSFFTVPGQNGPVKPGDLIVAEPFMRDKWFGRSVVLILDNEKDKGSSGLVLNNLVSATLSEVVSDVRTQGVPVYCGGPVGHDRLFFLHTLGDTIIPSASEIAPGLWIGGSFHAAVEYVNSEYPHEGTIRFFVGYSGWSSHQLDGELREKSWAVTTNHFSPQLLLTGEGGKYWHKIVSGLGAEFRPWLIIPQDARAN